MEGDSRGGVDQGVSGQHGCEPKSNWGNAEKSRGGGRSGRGGQGGC